MKMETIFNVRKFRHMLTKTLENIEGKSIGVDFKHTKNKKKMKQRWYYQRLFEGKYKMLLKSKIGPREATERYAEPPIIDLGMSDLIYQNKIKVINTEIKKFTKNGILCTDNKYHIFDAIILATGFQKGMPVIQNIYEKKLINQVLQMNPIFQSGIETLPVQKQLYFIGYQVEIPVMLFK